MDSEILFAGSGRDKISRRVIPHFERRLQARDIKLLSGQFFLQAITLGFTNGRIDLDQGIPGLDGLSVLDMDSPDDAGFERLHDLRMAGRDDLAGRRRNDIDLAKAGP